MPEKKSDLGVRTLSAIVMVAVAGGALWLGGWVWTAFVVAVGLGVLWEFWGLVRRIAKTPLGAALWLVAGVSYVGVAMAVLVGLRGQSVVGAVAPIILVIAVDVGAYFAGRSIGGPKIAPAISPSKTWAGLVGGAMAAAVVTSVGNMIMQWITTSTFIDTRFDTYYVVAPWWSDLAKAAIGGTLIAIIAQSGDFFESWMKRRAGVKDSGTLIPGHGGLFDRVDGLLAVLFVGGIIMWVAL